MAQLFYVIEQHLFERKWDCFRDFRTFTFYFGNDVSRIIISYK